MDQYRGRFQENQFVRYQRSSGEWVDATVVHVDDQSGCCSLVYPVKSKEGSRPHRRGAKILIQELAKQQWQPPQPSRLDAEVGKVTPCLLLAQAQQPEKGWSRKAREELETLRRADAKLARRLEDFLGRISGEVRDAAAASEKKCETLHGLDAQLARRLEDFLVRVSGQVQAAVASSEKKCQTLHGLDAQLARRLEEFLVRVSSQVQAAVASSEKKDQVLAPQTSPGLDAQLVCRLEEILGRISDEVQEAVAASEKKCQGWSRDVLCELEAMRSAHEDLANRLDSVSQDVIVSEAAAPLEADWEDETPDETLQRPSCRTPDDEEDPKVNLKPDGVFKESEADDQPLEHHLNSLHKVLGKARDDLQVARGHLEVARDECRRTEDRVSEEAEHLRKHDMVEVQSKLKTLLSNLFDLERDLELQEEKREREDCTKGEIQDDFANIANVHKPNDTGGFEMDPDSGPILRVHRSGPVTRSMERAMRLIGCGRAAGRETSPLLGSADADESVGF